MLHVPSQTRNSLSSGLPGWVLVVGGRNKTRQDQFNSPELTTSIVNHISTSFDTIYFINTQGSWFGVLHTLQWLCITDIATVYLSSLSHCFIQRRHRLTSYIPGFPGPSPLPDPQCVSVPQNHSNITFSIFSIRVLQMAVDTQLKHLETTFELLLYSQKVAAALLLKGHKYKFKQSHDNHVDLSIILIFPPFLPKSAPKTKL